MKTEGGNNLAEEVPLEPLVDAFRTYIENGKRASHKLILKNTLAHERVDRERKRYQELTDRYAAIPIPDPIKSALSEMSRIFLERAERVSRTCSTTSRTCSETNSLTQSSITCQRFSELKRNAQITFAR